MNFELITVNEYYGNSYCGSREAKLYTDGRLEYIPLPEYPDDDLDEEEDDDEDE
jgi:hypothetical protein